MAQVNQVITLFNGYSYLDPADPKIFISNCTCVLIKGLDGYNIIVDTMNPWDGPKILEALKEHSIKPEDISAVVSTHGHPDHTGNNNLFLNAKWHIVGQTIMHKDKFLIHIPFTPFELTRDIRVIETEGHTLSCVSVIVENSSLGGVTAISGDLFEKKEDIDDPVLWQEVGSENQKAQFKNRSKIADMANWIIPGHGEGFEVTLEIREKLQQQFKNN
ncbi:metallo-beta-lactamase domain-containing protein 1 [Episyrphus balteatus]|uniref:metallo-beta-lactamase domain-containing protein 1 n=1 Tax=Episyrphus balteatus TaxID=286459 RepID=UPI002485C5F2|nr:metallo-beta-lactamase domain-containing protein 1 [Episyrphus balteatus]